MFEISNNGEIVKKYEHIEQVMAYLLDNGYLSEGMSEHDRTYILTLDKCIAIKKVG